MKMKYDYLLPLGSIVKLKNGKKKVMIFGYLQKGMATGDKVFDYTAVPYPEGLYDQRMRIGFDHADIEDVIFRGYEDEDRKAFLVILEIAARKMEAQAAEGNGEV